MTELEGFYGGHVIHTVTSCPLRVNAREAASGVKSKAGRRAIGLPPHQRTNGDSTTTPPSRRSCGVPPVQSRPATRDRGIAGDNRA